MELGRADQAAARPRRRCAISVVPTTETVPAERRRQSKDIVAIILAIGVCTAINLVTAAIMWDAVKVGAEISENGTQILTGVLGGAVGVLGSYLGYSAALTNKTGATPAPPETPSVPPSPDPSIP